MLVVEVGLVHLLLKVLLNHSHRLFEGNAHDAEARLELATELLEVLLLTAELLGRLNMKWTIGAGGTAM